MSQLTRFGDENNPKTCKTNSDIGDVIKIDDVSQIVTDYGIYDNQVWTEKLINGEIALYSGDYRSDKNAILCEPAESIYVLEQYILAIERHYEKFHKFFSKEIAEEWKEKNDSHLSFFKERLEKLKSQVKITSDEFKQTEKQLENIIEELEGLVYYNQNIQHVIEDIKNKGVQSEYINMTDPDTEQICIKITEDIWLYSQSDDYIVDGKSILNGNYEYDTNLLDLSLYASEDFDKFVSGYYNDLDHLKEENGDAWKQILLECAFEQQVIKFNYDETLKSKLSTFQLLPFQQLELFNAQNAATSNLLKQG